MSDEAGEATTGEGQREVAPRDPSGSFFEFQKLCKSIEAESGLSNKTARIREFLGTFHGDAYLVCRFLLVRNDHRVFHLKEKAIAKILSRCLGAPLDDVVSDATIGGSIDATAKKFFEQRGKPRRWSTLTLAEVDDWLERLSQLSKEDEQVEHFENLISERGCTAEDFRLVVALIRRDIGINAGPRAVLDGVHPDAYQAFRNTNNLKRVVRKALSGNFAADMDGDGDGDGGGGGGGGGKDEDDGDGEGKGAEVKAAAGVPKPLARTLTTSIALNCPIKPQLCKATKSIVEVIERFPGGFFSEIKYDGERIQVHKDGDSLTCYSRKLKPIMPWKVKEVEEFIPKGIKARQVILDGEILLMDIAKHVPLPFGTLGVHKKNRFADATVCIFFFDILFLDGRTLMAMPIVERRKLLEETVNVIPNRIELSEMKVIHDEETLAAMMTRVIQEKLEGLVIKELTSTYEPDCRHWLKIKKDYLEGGKMADSADLIVLGGYYGHGESGGLVTTFLMCVYDAEEEKFLTVCKCGSGHDDATIARFQEELLSGMVKIDKDYSRVPSWLLVNRSIVPDYVAKDPKKAPIWEVTGAQFSESDRHTASGLSIRFPRVTRIRDDKDWSSATTLNQLVELSKASTKDFVVKARGKGAKAAADPDAGSKDAAPPAKKSKPVAAASSAPAAGAAAAPRKQSAPPTPIARVRKIDGKVLDTLSGSVSGRKVILHIIDDSGRWPSDSLSKTLARAWPHIAEKVEKQRPSIGEGVWEKVEAPLASKLFVFMAACRHKLAKGGSTPFQQKAFEMALGALVTLAKHKDATVHFQKPPEEIPKFDWETVEGSLNKILCMKGITTYVYDEAPVALLPVVRAAAAAAAAPADMDTEPDEALRPAERMDVDAGGAGAPSENPFEGLRVLVLVEGDSGADISRAVQSLGGTIVEGWDGSGEVHPTHAICEIESDQASIAMAFGAAVVRPSWVWESMKRRSRAMEAKHLPAERRAQASAADASTEEDEPEDVAEECSSDGPLLNLFTKCRILISGLPQEQEALLKRYIIAHDGIVDATPAAGITHVVAAGALPVPVVQACVGSAVVNANWVWDSINARTIRDPTLYAVVS